MIRIMIVAVAATLIAATISSCSGGRASPNTGPMSLKPCEVQGVRARCGTFVVLENRTKPDGRTIGLRVVVLPASSTPVAKDAVTYLACGPGDAATEEAANLSQELVQLNEHRDILLVDQRGTGSDAYTCPDRTQPFRSNADLRTYTLGCLNAFGGDVNQYATRAAMDDLDAVRAALGYRQLEVIGSSYGASAAQVYLNLHPSAVRTLMLDGATAIDVPILGRWARNAQRALDQLVKLCDSQPACRKAFPDWERQFGQLVNAWNAHPVKTGKGGAMTGDQLAGVVHVMLLDLEKAVSIPHVVSSAAKGDYAPLNDQDPGDLAAPNPQLMAWSIWCNEPWAGLSAKGPWGTEFDSYTAAKIAAFRRGCTFIPKRTELCSLWTLPSSSRTPVLAFEGGAAAGSRHEPVRPQAPLPGQPHRDLPAHRAPVRHRRLRRPDHGGLRRARHHQGTGHDTLRRRRRAAPVRLKRHHRAANGRARSDSDERPALLPSAILPQRRDGVVKRPVWRSAAIRSSIPVV